MSKDPKKKYPRPKRQIHGLFARNYPRSVRWKLDADYTRDLTPAEQAWLADFLDQHYGAKFNKNRRVSFPRAMRQQAYREKNYANADLYAKCSDEMLGQWHPETWDAASHTDPAVVEDVYIRSMLLRRRADPPASVRDFSPTPEYLSSPEYREALAEYRSTLDQTKHERPPKPSRKHTAAKARILEVANVETDPQAEPILPDPDLVDL